MSEMEDITRTFGEAYRLAKEAGKQQAEYQQKFFSAATTELEKQVLAQKVVELPNTADDAGHIATEYPGWRLVEAYGDTALIEADPALMKFTYVNRYDGYVYARTISEAAPTLDLVAIQEEDNELWREITQWDAALVSLLSLTLGVDEVEEFLDAWGEPHGFTRELVDFTTLPDEILERLDPYWIPGKVSVRLVPPREAHAEELES